MTHHVTFQTRTVVCGFSSRADPHQHPTLSRPKWTLGAKLTQCHVCAPRRGTQSCGFSHRNLPNLSVCRTRWCQQQNPFSGGMYDLPEVRRRRIPSPGHASLSVTKIALLINEIQYPRLLSTQVNTVEEELKIARYGPTVSTPKRVTCYFLILL